MKIETFSILAGTAACNARCPYCISKMTGIKQMGFKEPEINWRNFHKACRLAQLSGVTTVLITGKGETTLYPEQITKFLEHLKEFDFPLLEIQTNGIILDNEEYIKHLKKWYDLGLNTIAISVVHYDDSKNKSIFCHGVKNGEDYPKLEHLIKKLHDMGFSVRLSCIMVKGYIDSPKEVEKLAEFAKKNNVEQLTLRKIWYTEKSENKEISEWSEKHIVSDKNIKEIKKYLDKNAAVLMTLPHGAIIYELKKNKQNICLTDCVMINPKNDEIRTLIFFPDGHLRYNWEYGGAILL